jgi:hypothetical protein
MQFENYNQSLDEQTIQNFFVIDALYLGIRSDPGQRA